MSVLDFPIEITLLIFSYVESATRDGDGENASKQSRFALWSLLGACRAWRGLAADSSLWRTRILSPAEALWMVQHHPAAQFGLELALASAIKSDTFAHKAERHSEVLFDDLEGNEGLREGLRRAVVSLVLRRATGRDRDVKRLVSVFSDSVRLARLIDRDACCHLDNLTWLPWLERATVHELDVSPGTLASALPRLRQLRVTQLCWRVPEGGAAPALEALTIQTIVSMDEEPLTRFIASCPNLRSLNLPYGREGIGPRPPTFLLPQLTSLDVPSEWLWNEEYLCVPNAIERFPVLTQLLLRIPAPCAATRHRADLARMLALMPSLRSLQMTIHYGIGEYVELGPPALLAANLRSAYPSLRHVKLELTNLKFDQMADRDPVSVLAQASGVFLECDLDWAAFWRARVAQAARSRESRGLGPIVRVNTTGGVRTSIMMGFPALVGETESGAVRASAGVLLYEKDGRLAEVTVYNAAFSLTLRD